MSATNPAALCQFDLPSGKTCRQVALKGESVCRHHARHLERNMYEITRGEAMQRLEACLNEMDLHELLLTLESKLNRIQRTIPAYDEARVTLRIAIKHLHRYNEDDAMILEFSRQFAKDPKSDRTRIEFQNVCEKIMRPMN